MNSLNGMNERLLDRSRLSLIKVCEQSAETMERLSRQSGDPIRAKKLQMLANQQKECAVKLRRRRQNS